MQFVQFEDTNGQLITTNADSLTLLRRNGTHIVFFGSKGRTFVTEQVFEEIHSGLGMKVPAISNPVQDDVDDDFITPSND